ncbi:hypothetical protein SLE2022_330100 [Rubroshorea leprosula]
MAFRPTSPTNAAGCDLPPSCHYRGHSWDWAPLPVLRRHLRKMNHTAAIDCAVRVAAGVGVQRLSSLWPQYRSDADLLQLWLPFRCSNFSQSARRKIEWSWA